MNGTHPLNGILCLTAITPLHPGAGSGLGLIDNPIIRERATGFPFIQAPSLKGVLRAAANDYWGDANKIKTFCLFGPERSGGDHHEGALVLNDARILAMPVRSFKGLFVWVTSPQALYRFFRDFSMTGEKIDKQVQGAEKSEWNYWLWLNSIKGGLANNARIPKDTYKKLCINVGTDAAPKYNLYLEEYEISATEDDSLKILADYLSTSFFNDSYLKDLIKINLVLLDDERFRYFVEHATQIEANIAIDQDTGTTTQGSLRYTEFLPEQTLLYSSYRLSARDYSQNKQNPAKLQDELMGEVNFLQIGGDGTTGKGFIQIKPIPSITENEEDNQSDLKVTDEDEREENGADVSKSVSNGQAVSRKEQAL